MIGKTISHYKILEKIGEGGMGVVYKAEDTKLKRTVALKFLSPQAVGGEEDKKRFVREAQAAAALHHPNICTVYEIDEAEGQTFIAMAYLDGQSLKEKTETKPLKLDEAVDIAMQVADGLHEAHDNGIIHRDIKSSNVMVTTKGQAILMDFGLAKQAGKTMITKEGTSMGTVAYMSPEQAEGAIVDHRTDVWSFGVMLYEMVTGQLPFKGDYDEAVIYSIKSEEPEPMTGLRTGVPMELERIANKAVAKNPAERYQNVNDMLIDLRSVAKELEVGTSKARLTTTRLETETRGSFFKNLFERRIPQILGLYFAASFGILQFVEWLVRHYPISPHLGQFSFVALVSMIPTVYLLAYFHGKPGPDRWTRFERIGIPINLLASAALLVFLFQDKNLGATTTTITLQDEAGNEIERVIPKSAFRKKLALFFFDNASGDSTLNWLIGGITFALACDLDQDLFLWVVSDFNEKLQRAGYPDAVGVPLSVKRKLAQDSNLDYFVSASFAQENEDFSVETSLFETKRAKLLQKRKFTHADIFALIDTMSVQLKYDLGIPEHQIVQIVDLPLSEILTNSMSAFRSLMLGFYAIYGNNDWETGAKYFEQAVKENPRNALAQYFLAVAYFSSNQMEKAASAAQAAMEHLYNLPERWQFYTKYRYYSYIEQDTDKVFRVLKMWVDLYPDDMEAHSILASYYRYRKRQPDDAIAVYQRMLELDPQQHRILIDIGFVHREKGDYREALKYFQQYADQFPTAYSFRRLLGGTYEEMGDYEKAKLNYEKALVLDSNDIHAMRDLADVQSKLGNFNAALEGYHNALKNCKTPRQRSDVYRSISNFYELRGQLKKSLEYFELGITEQEKYDEPIDVIDTKLRNLERYIQAGQTDVAFQKIRELEAQLQPPYDDYVHLGYLEIYLELEDADRSEKALEALESYMQISQDEGFRGVVLSARGQIHELRGEHEQAMQIYQKELELNPTNATIHRKIGRCYRNLNEFKKAEELVEKTLKIYPNGPLTNSEMALVYWGLGKKKKALEHLRTALKVWENADLEYKPAKEAREKLAEWSM